MILDPPAIYDHEPAGPYVVIERSSEEVEKLCKTLGAKHSAMACTWKTDTGCTIVAPRIGIGGVGILTHIAIMRHEKAHCNGWVHP